MRIACGSSQENLHLTAMLSWQKFWARRMWASPAPSLIFSIDNNRGIAYIDGYCHLIRTPLCYSSAMPSYSDEEIVKIIDEAISDRSESIGVEFKDARGGLPSGVWRTISSFSHKPGGGIIIFGIKEEDNGNVNVVGGLDLARLQEKISDLLNTVMQNCGRPEYRIIDYMSHRLLALVVHSIPAENSH